MSGPCKGGIAPKLRPDAEQRLKRCWQSTIGQVVEEELKTAKGVSEDEKKLILESINALCKGCKNLYRAALTRHQPACRAAKTPKLNKARLVCRQHRGF